MKNVTIAIDDETHRQARIRAAELGTSLSALVKGYLNGLVAGGEPPPTGLRDVQMPFKHAEPVKDGPPWLVDGKWVYTRDGKPRRPGALRGKLDLPDDWDKWSPEELDSFEAWPYDDPDFDALPFDEAQLKGL